MVEAILVEGLVYGILAIGVFITFRVLDFPDLTVEGSFPLGAATAASALVSGYPYPIAVLLAILAGALAGAYGTYSYSFQSAPSSCGYSDDDRPLFYKSPNNGREV